MAFGLFILYDRIVRNAQMAQKAWIQHTESRRLPLACVGGPLYAIAIFWLAWSCFKSVHWIVPMLAGLPFGVGFLLIFMALINYVSLCPLSDLQKHQQANGTTEKMADAYGIYAASAMAAASTTRSLCGAMLPLATGPMYERLGLHWATSLLGFFSVAAAVIPWVFIKYGNGIRARSKFAQSLKS